MGEQRVTPKYNPVWQATTAFVFATAAAFLAVMLLQGGAILSVIMAFLLVVTAVLGLITWPHLRIKSSKAANIAFGLMAGYLLVASFFLLKGLLQDSMGVYCSGFSDVQTSCVSGAVFMLMFVLLDPYILLPFLFVVLLLLGLSLRRSPWPAKSS